ncbi:MAG: retention module-containing protein, partial [Pseudomonas sp.]|nr:retention module-containing protein [Pseudomonas sp.]
MSNFVAVIKSLVGQVFVVSLDGLKRQVFEGERLFQGDQVVTASGAAATLELADGDVIDVTANGNWQAAVAQAPEQVQTTQAPASELEQAIAAGFDPTADLEPTAAGPGAAGGAGGAPGGGHSFVMLDETAQQLDPTVGFETDGLGIGDAAQDEILGLAGDSFIDITPPPAPALTLLVDSGIAGDLITNNGTYSVSGTEAGATVEYSTNGSDWSTTAPTAEEGDNTIFVRQTDVAGNTSAPSSLSFTLDTLVEAPSITLDTDSGSSDSDAISNTGSYSIGNLEAGASVEYSTDGSDWSTTAPTAEEGENTIFVRQTDVAGNTSAPSSLTFTLDTQATIAIATISGDDTINAAETDDVTISGTTTGVDNGQIVTIKVNGSEVGTATVADGTWSLPNVDLSGLTDGTLNVTAEVTDLAGNPANATRGVALDASAVAGTVTVNNITADDVINAAESNQTIAVTGTATGGDIAEGDAVTMTINGTDYDTTVDAAGNWTVNVAGGDLANDTEFEVVVSSSD